MSTINKLSTIDSLQSSDKLVIWDNSNGDSRKTALQTLTTYLQSALTFTTASGGYTTQRAAPGSTGFTVAITDGADDIHLILTPTAGYATGTITLPATANAVDKQLVMVNTTRAVDALTIAGNGAANVVGAPSALSVDSSFILKYDLAFTTWYKVG